MGNRVLLVEDHRDTSNVFARMLRRDGFDVSVAHTFAEASDLCRQGEFDVVISDINLPDGDGAEILAAARKSRPLTPGIIVSGRDEDEQRARAQAAGFAHYFLKPLDYPSLHKVLQEATGWG